MKHLQFLTSQDAWCGIIEYFLNHEEEILKTGGLNYKALLVSYDTFIEIDRNWVDPEFDFNKMFNYKVQKWRGLINNYIDFNYLDIVKSEIIKKEISRNQAYNISYVFDNSHQHGKNCLLSCTFIKRPKQDVPLISVTIRASEIVKRLIFDFLLLQRIVEYVYGEGKHVRLKIYFPHMFASAETIAVYNLYKPLRKVIQPNGGKFQNEVQVLLEKFKSVDPETISYKVHRRAALAIQKKVTGGKLLAKNLNF